MLEKIKINEKEAVDGPFLKINPVLELGAEIVSLKLVSLFGFCLGLKITFVASSYDLFKMVVPCLTKLPEVDRNFILKLLLRFVLLINIIWSTYKNIFWVDQNVLATFLVNAQFGQFES